MTFSREWTIFSGYFNARKDPVDIAPQSGTMIGGRWDWRMGGPAYLTARVAHASLDRRIIDPTKPIADRFVGTETVPLLFSDVDLGLSLTGFKTWHSLAPSLNGGFGTTWDTRGRHDVGKFKFGSPFTVNFGASLKWIVSGRWQVRGDWVNYIYQIHYPESYYLRTGTDLPVRLPGDPTSLWRRNVAYQFGLSYLYHR